MNGSNDSLPKFSIITATYNSEHTLLEALESVVQQTYENIEVIVIDGKSSDSTLEIIKSFTNRIDKFISEPDKGIYDALNKGISLASGDYIGFLHSDDAFTSKDSIKKLAETVINLGECDAVYGNLHYVSRSRKGKVVRRWVSSSFKPFMLNYGWMPPHPSLYLNRRVYEKYGGFDAFFKIAADYESILRFFSKPSFNALFVPEVIVDMKLGGASNGGLKAIFNKSKEDLRALRKNKMPMPLLTLCCKNIRKITQFF